MLSIPKRISGRVPAHYDPIRRLIAAITVLAITDYVRPPKNLAEGDRQSDKQFVHDQTGLIADFAQVNEETVAKMLDLPQGK